MSEFQSISAADITDMIESPPPFDTKLNKIVTLASSAIGAAIYHVPSCRRMKVMTMLKTAFMNNMEGNVIGISEMVLVGVYAFFDSVAEYDEDTAVDKSKMAEIWDVMAKLPIVHDCVTEYARNKQHEEKKEEKKKEKEKEKEKKEKEKEKKKEEREKEKEKKKELADMNRKYIAKLKLVQKLKEGIDEKVLALADAEKEMVELGGKFVEMGKPLPELPSESSELSSELSSEAAASEAASNDAPGAVEFPQDWDKSDSDEDAPIEIPEGKKIKHSTKKRRIAYV